MNLNETDIEGDGISGERPRLVTNGDLRVDIQRLTTEFRGMRNDIRELKEAGVTSGKERRDSDGRAAKMEGAMSVLRWALGLVAAGAGSTLVWVFTNLNETINTNRSQEIRLTNEEQGNRVRDTRIQALERGQFATTMKERP